MEAVQPALRAIDLTVSYGAARGISGIDLDVPVTGVTGLLGPNGAGKSTLLRAALDLVHPALTQGFVWTSFLVLLGASLILAAIGLLAFGRRNLRA